VREQREQFPIAPHRRLAIAKAFARPGACLVEVVPDQQPRAAHAEGMTASRIESRRAARDGALEMTEVRRAVHALFLRRSRGRWKRGQRRRVEIAARPVRPDRAWAESQMLTVDVVLAAGILLQLLSRFPQ